jgi:hypothetical protein
MFTDLAAAVELSDLRLPPLSAGAETPAPLWSELLSPVPVEAAYVVDAAPGVVEHSLSVVHVAGDAAAAGLPVPDAIAGVSGASAWDFLPPFVAACLLVAMFQRAIKWAFEVR